MKTTAAHSAPTKARRPLRLGFVPLTDCAPLVLAQELGLYRKFGLEVTLHRELGWATIRDKVIYDELDAAHAVAGLPLAVTLGLGGIRCECLTALVLNLHGNAITLSNDLWKQGVRDGQGFAQFVRQERRNRMFTLGIVSLHSSHHFLLRQWLQAAGLSPERDVRLVVVPPPQMPVNLKAGHLDGFCAGEPWNSLAVQKNAGWCVATSAELAPGHPEKVLMVRRTFAEKRTEEHLALVAALLEACAYCADPANRHHVVATLARPEFVGVPVTVLRQTFEPPFHFGHNQIRPVPDFNVFAKGDANEPTEEKMRWLLDHFRAANLCPDSSLLTPALGRQIFRRDIFTQAVRQRRSLSTLSSPHENKPSKEPVLA